MKFDVHRSKYPFDGLGVLLTTIEAPTKRAADELAAERYRGVAVITIRHTEACTLLERALRRLRSASVTKRDARRGDHR